ncbi:hypothetical protein GCM10009096_25370 [Parasphingorhabdus litoris]|uniref:Uncharacterized protein n=1 Tax=Parasphingorhabdus litoris TaxID=394733 RepID=A0ABP3KL15_9SPHN
MTTNNMGTLATSENNATKRTCRRPLLPTADFAALPLAIRRPSNTSKIMAGIKFATSKAAVSGGEIKSVRPD